MHLGRVDEALDFVRRIRGPIGRIRELDVALCPPFPVLVTLADVLRPSPIGLGAQNMHWEDAGAHTGEVAPTMLAGHCASTSSSVTRSVEHPRVPERTTTPSGAR